MKRSDLLALLLLSVLTLLVRSPDLAMPLERDEGEYAYAAQEIERGGMPYRDTFCQKPPVVFFWYLAGFHLFGETAVGIHLTMAVAAALTAFGLLLLGRRLAGPGAGWLAALAYTLGSPGAGYFGSAANTEVFMLAPAVFGAYYLVTGAETGRAWRWLAAGALMALAVLTKQVAVFTALGPWLFAAGVAYRRRGPWAPAAGTLLLAVGAAAVTLPVVLWLARGDALQAFLEAAYFHNLTYVGSPFGLWKWKLMGIVLRERFLVSDGVLWLCMLAGILSLAGRSFRKVPAVGFAALWFASSLPGVALGPYAFGHYFLQVLPPLALMVGGLCHALATRAGSTGEERRSVAGLVAVLALAPAVLTRIGSLSVPAEERSFDLYKVYGPVPFAAAQDLGLRLRDSLPGEARLLVVGSEPEILFYARRQSSTRFTISYPLTGDHAATDVMTEEVFAECQAHPPEEIVLCYTPSSFIIGPTASERRRRLFARVRQMIEAGGYERDVVYWGDGAEVHGGPRLPRGAEPLLGAYRKASPKAP
jgi:4-amino-4-deoxy-L-arabinose transferase-like glycosyltransferase